MKVRDDESYEMVCLGLDGDGCEVWKFDGARGNATLIRSPRKSIGGHWLIPLTHDTVSGIGPASQLRAEKGREIWIRDNLKFEQI